MFLKAFRASNLFLDFYKDSRKHAAKYRRWPKSSDRNVISEEGNEGRKVPFRARILRAGDRIFLYSLQVPKSYTQASRMWNANGRGAHALSARNSTLFLSRDCTDTRGLRMRVRDTPYSSIPFLISSFFLTGSVSAYSREYFTGGSTRDQRFCIIHVYYYTRRVYMCTRMYVCKYAWVCV